LDLLSNKVDVAMGDSGQTARFAAQYPQVLDLFPDRPLEMTTIAWAVRPGDLELLHFMNVAIRNLQTSGRLASLLRQYKVPPGAFLVPALAATPWK
jgi:ABC-type amino acid transport substrate-binding protein